MRDWNRPDLLEARSWCITATVVCSIFPSATPNGCAETGIEPSVGSVGDSYYNDLAETLIGLYKTEFIRQRCPWRNLEHMEFETLEWVDWFNNSRLFTTIGDIPPIELEQLYYEKQEAQPEILVPN